MIIDQKNVYFILNINAVILFSLAVAPVVPELIGDDDTSNFEDINEPDGGNETFELTKVCFNIFQPLAEVAILVVSMEEGVMKFCSHI